MSGGLLLDPGVCYRAAVSRDARFDGRFFVGVTTTGVYCRPVCPAPPPRLPHCRFYATAPAAQAAGFRPCLRCRPEVGPHTPAWLGTSATVQRAMRLISEGVLSAGGVSDLAARLGMSERHLRRLFAKHVGANPIQVAQTNRLLLAKQLIDGTDLPMVEVALAAGYRSVRRFNDTIVRTYGRTPRQLRRRRGSAARDFGLPGALIRLPYRPPYDFEGLLEFLTRRAIPGVEEVVGGVYRRVIRVGDGAGFLEVQREAGRDSLLARIQLPAPAPLLPLVARLRQLFDVEADSEGIDRTLFRDARLRALVRRRPGTRVPGAWDPFELSVRAILGQQVSVRGASTLAGRLAEKYGQAIPAPPPGSALCTAFPHAEALADADVAAIGLPLRRARAVRALARACADGALSRELFLDADALTDALCAIDGIGAWTARYVAMRAARDPDVLLDTDLGVRRALAGRRGPPTPAQIASRAERWRPWRSYAVLYLWSADAAGAPLSNPTGRRARGGAVAPVGRTRG